MKLNFLLQSLVNINFLEIFTTYLPFYYTQLNVVVKSSVQVKFVQVNNVTYTN